MDEEKIKLSAIIPCGEILPTAFVTSFMKLKDWMDCRDDIEFNYVIMTTKPLDVARNRGVEMALDQQHADQILFLDSDMIFDRQIYDRLARHKKDIVSALYFAKYHPYRPVIRLRDYKEDKYKHLIDYPDDELIKIGGCGMGACLIDTKVFKDMPKPYFTFGKGYGEDIYFCRQAETLGFEVWCDTGMKLRHWGGLGIGHESYLHVKKKLLENPQPGISVAKIREALEDDPEFHHALTLPEKMREEDGVPQEVMVNTDSVKKIMDTRIVNELIEFTGFPEKEVLTNMAYGVLKVGDEFRLADPKGDEQVENFYRNCKEYLWDLSGWHASPAKRRQNREYVASIKEKYPDARTILDYGCGIGENGLMMAKAGYEVTLVDFDTNSFKFAKFRAKNYSDNVKFLTFDEFRANLKDYKEKFDLVLCLDVLEHLTPKQLKQVIDELKFVKKPKGVGELLMSVAFGMGTNTSHPMHFGLDKERADIIKAAFNDEILDAWSNEV